MSGHSSTLRWTRGREKGLLIVVTGRQPPNASKTRMQPTLFRASETIAVRPMWIRHGRLINEIARAG